jgi:hypothetical protein
MKHTLKVGKKDQEWSGLLKIPDSEVIKQLRIDLGKANSYIQELECKIKEYDKPKPIKRAHVEHLEKQVETLRNQLLSCRNRLLKFSIENQLLQKQLLETLK